MKTKGKNDGKSRVQRGSRFLLKEKKKKKLWKSKSGYTAWYVQDLTILRTHRGYVINKREATLPSHSTELLRTETQR